MTSQFLFLSLRREEFFTKGKVRNQGLSVKGEMTNNLSLTDRQQYAQELFQTTRSVAVRNKLEEWVGIAILQPPPTFAP